MRVANSSYCLRIIFDDLEELESIVGKRDAASDRPVVHVALNANSPTRFLMLSKHEIPGSFAMGASRERSTDTFATQLMLSGKRFARAALPFFAPESVVVKSSNDHKGTIIELMRPPMQRAPISRSPSPKSLAKLERAKQAALKGPAAPASSLPKIPPQVPLEAMEEASSVMTSESRHCRHQRRQGSAWRADDGDDNQRREAARPRRLWRRCRPRECDNLTHSPATAACV